VKEKQRQPLPQQRYTIGTISLLASSQQQPLFDIVTTEKKGNPFLEKGAFFGKTPTSFISDSRTRNTSAPINVLLEEHPFLALTKRIDSNLFFLAKSAT